MKNKLSVLAGISALFILTAASGQAVMCCRSSLEMCARLIIPRLFPFFLLSSFLNSAGLPRMLGRVFGRWSRRLFGVSGAGFSAFFMGICGGYPLGAAAAGQMEEQDIISSAEAEKLLVFCNNTGPAFIIGAAGSGIFHSSEAGLLLYTVHIISAVLCGIICRGRCCSASDAPAVPQPEISPAKAFTEAVQKSIVNTLNVCGFALSFGIFTGLLDVCGFLPSLCLRLSDLFSQEPAFFSALIKGLIELCSGISSMEGFPLRPANLALAAFLLGFGGLSVHFQTMSLFADKDISCLPHFAGRIISASLAALLAYICFPVLL